MSIQITILKCARTGCPNQFPKNGKQKFCGKNCATLDHYHRTKILSGRHARAPIARRNICSVCGGYKVQVFAWQNRHYETSKAKVGMVCLPCKILELNKDWRLE